MREDSMARWERYVARALWWWWWCVSRISGGGGGSGGGDTERIALHLQENKHSSHQSHPPARPPPQRAP